MGRKALTIGVILATALASLMAAALVAPLKASAAGCASGSLIKGTLPAVYYCGADGKRYVFTNDKNYFTWYADFSGVAVVSDSVLADIAIGGNVTYRPGRKMLKIQSDPRTYVIAHGGVLRHVPSEACAATLYGSNWNTKIDDVSDAFFVNYSMGAALTVCADYSPTAELALSPTINADKSLTPAGSAPSVTSVTPPSGSANVAVGADVTATFNVAMDASTLNGTTFTLTKSGTGTGSVSGAVTYSGNTATFNPNADLEAGATYTARITTGAKSQSGAALSADYSWSFTAGGSASAPVQVTSITPPDGGTGVSTSTAITATFSGAMNASTINAGTFTLKKGATAVAGTVNYTGNTATFTPGAALDANATYTATITSGAKDMSGNAVSGGSFSWSFTTAS